jgi:predicted HicB family RNase H-like nuclease
MLDYKGYMAGKIDIDPESGILSGIVAGLVDVVHFEGRTAEELVVAFKESVDDYLAFCAERSEAPDKPYSGKILLRTAPELHRKAAQRAEAEGLSLSKWIERQIDAA